MDQSLTVVLLEYFSNYKSHSVLQYYKRNLCRVISCTRTRYVGKTHQRVWICPRTGAKIDGELSPMPRHWRICRLRFGNPCVLRPDPSCRASGSATMVLHVSCFRCTQAKRVGTMNNCFAVRMCVFQLLAVLIMKKSPCFISSRPYLYVKYSHSNDLTFLSGIELERDDWGLLLVCLPFWVDDDTKSVWHLPSS